MPALIAAAIGAGGQLLGTGLEFAGGLMQSNAGASRRTIRRRGRYALDQARSQDALFGGLEESALKAAHGRELEGFRGARGALTQAGAAARQGVLDRGKQNQAALEQSIVSKGLLGTTTGAGAFAGLQDQTSRHLSDIDLQLAQQFADLGLQESGLRGQQGRELAGLAGRNRQFQRGLGEANFGLLTMG